MRNVSVDMILSIIIVVQLTKSNMEDIGIKLKKTEQAVNLVSVSNIEKSSLDGINFGMVQNKINYLVTGID